VRVCACEGGLATGVRTASVKGAGASYCWPSTIVTYCQSVSPHASGRRARHASLLASRTVSAPPPRPQLPDTESHDLWTALRLPVVAQELAAERLACIHTDESRCLALLRKVRRGEEGRGPLPRCEHTARRPD
jgi:hypothetical protein